MVLRSSERAGRKSFTTRTLSEAKWLQELEALLKGTRTPLGKVLESKADDKNLPGGASTLRAQVRAAKKYLGWLAVADDAAFPTEVSHLTGFLEPRHSEPCNRGALKAAHQCMAFLEDVAGVEEKLTTNTLYTVVYKELLSTAQPGRAPKQAPLYPLAVLESLEELVLEESATFYFRVYAVCRSPMTQPAEGLRSEGKRTLSQQISPARRLWVPTERGGPDGLWATRVPVFRSSGLPAVLRGTSTFHGRHDHCHH